MTNTLDAEKLPANQAPVNQPESGTYGEKVATERLEQALPSTPGGIQPAQGQPRPPATPVRPVRSNRESGVPGVPAPILAPTNRPNVPLGTPLQQGAPAPVQTGAQRRMAILDKLANDPQVSESTREWARMVISVLAG